MFDIKESEAMRDLSQKLGIDTYPSEIQEQILGAFGENVSMRVATETLSHIPESEHEHFDQLAEAGKTSELHALIHTYIPNYDAFVTTIAESEISITKDRLAKI